MVNQPLVEGLLIPPWQQPRRFGVLYGLLIVTIVTLLGRSFYLQIWRGSNFLQAAEGNRVSIDLITAPRGIIYDTNGTQLVENIASTDLLIDPNLLPTEEFESPLIEQLPQLINRSPEDVRLAVASARQRRQPVVLAKAIDHDTVLLLEEAKPTLPGIRLVSSLVRRYPYADASAHTLGYTGPITAEELVEKSLYAPTDITGKTGIEKQYDEILHGTHGASYREVNAAGHTQKELGNEPPVAGSNLTLSLDQELQSYIQTLFADRAEQQAARRDSAQVSGAVVAIDPRSGAVRALVSYPAFDPNIFSQPAQRGSGASLFTDDSQPLFNRAIDGEFPPGSTIKPFLAAAGLAEGIITPQTTVLSTGKLSIGQWEFPDWKGGGHGVTDLNKAIAESVNTFFYLLAGGDDQRPGLGVVKIKKYLDEFGWGKPTKIDLPQEASGFLPSPEWKQTTKHEQWYIGDTYHLGIGQGDVLATPLQLAAATVAIANGGTWFEPHLIEKIAPPATAETVIKSSPRSLTDDIAPAHLAAVKDAMRATVATGSGRQLISLPVPLAGKTGTAQIGGSNLTHAWFTSFGPFDTPELVITVLLEKGGEGDKDAVPFTKNIWEWWVEHRYPK